MTIKQFNKKYYDYLETGHYGLDIDDREFIKWVDEKFQSFIKEPRFTYSQIKSKFDEGRFYCTGIDRNSIAEVENKITDLYK